MSNLFNNRENNHPEGFNPSVDNRIIKAQASTAAKIIVFISFILIIPIFWYISTSNKFNRQQNQINEAASNIDIQLTKRSETLTKMFDATKSYIKYEKSVLEDVTKMRSMVSNLYYESKIEARNDLDKLNNSIFGRLIAVSENYPELKADKMFIELSEESAYIEREIAASRRLYNRIVNEYNSDLFVFPKNVVAAQKNLETAALYIASTKQKEDVKLSMDN
ncbi:LemA family protein [Mycoplasmopsis ciconiae]|uniref:LemA family protein n=1 Tax=Mycoplasmopsis ciconiae TaxID=561067 RepID=A0ABU7MLM4_9BACT|nr:LemA family protein [Mycoplasmopsis ciconiae]